jgi:FkbM family methyltransferase
VRDGHGAVVGGITRSTMPSGRKEDVLRGRLKRLRSSQPFNRLATAGVRTVLRLVGGAPERVVRHLHRLGPVASRLPNGRVLRLWSRADDWVSNQVYWRGWEGYEPETSPLFYRLAVRAQVTVDLGAHVGFFSLLAAHANPAGRVFAFEPLEKAFVRLQDNVARNGLANVECIRSAAGTATGRAPFFFAELDGIPCSSSLSSDFMKGFGDVAETLVSVLAIDDFVRERGIPRVDLVKADTESTEPDALRGMARTLERDRPAIVCEVLSGRATAAPLEQILRPLGYRFYVLTPEGPRREQSIEGHPEWLNHLFTVTPPDELLRP